MWVTTKIQSCIPVLVSFCRLQLVNNNTKFVALCFEGLQEKRMITGGIIRFEQINLPYNAPELPELDCILLHYRHKVLTVAQTLVSSLDCCLYQELKIKPTLNSVCLQDKNLQNEKTNQHLETWPMPRVNFFVMIGRQRNFPASPGSKSAHGNTFVLIKSNVGQMKYHDLRLAFY